MVTVTLGWDHTAILLLFIYIHVLPDPEARQPAQRDLKSGTMRVQVRELIHSQAASPQIGLWFKGSGGTAVAMETWVWLPECLMTPREA
ncbi:hypothetical protein NQZ68_036291 [Dissostichus eleginoides]|nr:hypothetical protein NQZ68_036291 [Dissostichus eleginoides]